MVAGHVPFQDSSFAGMRKQILAANFSIQCFNHVPIDIFSVIVELLMINPDRRLTISQILRRSMMRDSQACAPHNSTQSPRHPEPSIVGIMRSMGYKPKEIIESLRDQKFNQEMATYLIQ